MTSSLYGRYALRSLRRNGQRTVLAAVCVAFGVMSLVALWLLASIVRDAVMIEPRVALGGDVQFFAYDTSRTPITDVLAELRADGVVDQAIVFHEQTDLVLKPANAPVYVLGRALGVDPTTYPLLGTIALHDGRSLADTLQQPGDAVVSRDVARNAQLAVGNTVTVGVQGSGVPVRMRVAGIAEHMPDGRGATMLYSVATAQQIVGQDAVLNKALATWGPNGAALEAGACPDTGTGTGGVSTATARFVCVGEWDVQTADAAFAYNERIVRTFDMMLKGAGLLGLLVGGIGVANTMQVLLARRTGEIAMLKTLGYRRQDIVRLIACETALLGMVGSAAGIIAAIALSFPFLLLFNNTGGSLMATWRIDPWALLGGAAAGVVTAVIFGMTASVRASAVRPAALLRNQVDPPRSTRAATAGIWLVLGLVFAVLSSVILGSPVLGAGVLLVAIGGLLGLGGVLGGALVLLVRVPVRARSVVALAQHNLRRQGVRSVFALIALWAGVFAIGFATSTVGRASGRVTARSVDVGGDNVVVYARAADSAAVLQQLEQQHVQQVRTQLLAGITTTRAEGTPLPIAQLGGAAALGVDMVVEAGAAWGTQAGVYIQPTMIDSMLAEGQSLAIGDEITIRGANGTRTLPIVGTIAYPASYAIQVPLPALVAPDDVVREFGGERVTVYMIGQAPPNRLREVDVALNAALPQALAITDVSFNDALTRAVYNQFLFVVAIAGLALLAGAVLIANAVGLALIERRRELGILKAVGYSSGHVLRTVLIEHSVLGLISGAAGIVSVWLAIALANRQDLGLELVLDRLPALGIVAVAGGLAIGSALVVAWRPTHVRPLAVLQDA